MSRRILIYCFYDSEGIVDDYVINFLSSLKVFCEKIIIVVNGNLTDSSRTKLEEFTKKIYLRDNIGFDSTAYKEIIKMYGINYFKEYDEVILANSTFFGPIFDMSEVFSKMDEKEADVWAITSHPAQEVKVGNEILFEHLQSYFLVFRKSVINSPAFIEYLDNLKVATNYQEAVSFFELYTTKFFLERGFKLSSYIDADKRNIPQNMPSFFDTTYLIKNYRLPFIKRKIFSAKNNSLENSINGGIDELIEVLNKETGYKVDLIYDNIKRSYFKNTGLKDYFKKMFILNIKFLMLPHKKEHYREKIKKLKDTKYLIEKVLITK